MMNIIHLYRIHKLVVFKNVNWFLSLVLVHLSLCVFRGKNATFLKFKNLVSTLCEKDFEAKHFEAKHFRMTLSIFFCIFE